MPIWIWFIVIAAVAFCLGFTAGVTAMADTIGLTRKDHAGSMDRLMKELDDERLR